MTEARTPKRAEAPFRRRITLVRSSPTEAAGEVEDHVHHFRAVVRHADGVVTAAEGSAVRAPWSLCPGAVPALRELIGARVGTVAGVEDSTAHCTHLLDVALLTVRFAGSGLASRRYELTVSGWSTPRRSATLVRDDGARLAWEVADSAVVSPEPFAGRSLGQGFAHWARVTFEPDLAEMAIVLRRATWMSPSRGIDLDRFAVLRDSGAVPGTCFATQPARIGIARRTRGSTISAIADPARDEPHG